MNPIQFVGADTSHVAPKDWDAPKNGACCPLPTRVDEAGNIISVWELSPTERLRIAQGQNVVLTCFTIQPPVTLCVAAIYDENHTVLPTEAYEKFVAPKLSILARVKRAVLACVDFADQTPRR